MLLSRQLKTIYIYYVFAPRSDMRTCERHMLVQKKTKKSQQVSKEKYGLQTRVEYNFENIQKNKNNHEVQTPNICQFVRNKRLEGVGYMWQAEGYVIKK